MKKKVCLLITFVLSFFVFSSSVWADSISMYLKCNYADYCSQNAIEKFFNWINPWGGDIYSDINVFVPLTDGDGSVKLYGLEITDDDILVYNLENEYKNSDDSLGCWLKDENGYDGALVCNDKNSLDKSPQTMYITGTCPSCIVSQAGFDVWKFSKNVFNVNQLYNLQLPWFDKIENLYFVEESWEFTPLGTGSVDSSSSSYMDQTEYVVYSYINKKGVERKIAEGYVFEADKGYGAYAFVGPNIYSVLKDDIKVYQLGMISKQGSDFWKVHENFESRMVSSISVDLSSSGFWNTAENVCQKGEQDCINNHGYKTIIDSNDSNGNIKKSVITWYNQYNDKINELTGVFDTINNSDLNSTSEALNTNLKNGKSYSFPSNYNVENLISDLENAYAALEKTYNSDLSFDDCGTGDATLNPYGSAMSCLYSEVLDILEIKDLVFADEKNNDRYYLNQNFLVQAIKRDVSSALDEYLVEIGKSDLINVTNLSSELNEYVLLYYTTVSYLDASPVSFGLDSDLSDRVEKLRENFFNLVEDNDLNIYPVVDCKGLLGEGLINKINSYLDILKIVVPIILIAFGVLEFTKAIFANDDAQMKKAQQSFIKRIGISVIIFLTPTLLNFLLQLANKVWPIIEPSSCGIFE